MALSPPMHVNLKYRLKFQSRFEWTARRAPFNITVWTSAGAQCQRCKMPRAARTGTR